MNENFCNKQPETEIMRSIKLDIRTGTPLTKTKMEYIRNLSKCEIMKLLYIFNARAGHD